MTPLAPKFVERVWGSTSLAPWFPSPPPSSAGMPYGEVWFEGESLLIKFLFPAEKLSVQVHPADAYAKANEGCNGKTEMWHIMRAKPGATIALGFREVLTTEDARAAALDGSIMDLLKWHPVQRGDTFMIPAGTVHAMGEGLVVAEVQQVSDITYRLYDYGRGRPLHIDKGFDVAELKPYEPSETRCTYFETHHVEPGLLVEPRSEEDYLIGLTSGHVHRIDRTVQATEESLHTWVPE
ncbi:MAG: class I mannose-6-phosphate isomerase [Acidobacteriota bacterium]